MRKPLLISLFLFFCMFSQGFSVPNLDNFKFSVPNMTGYSPAQGYQFNATVTDNVAVDDVWIEHNFTGTLTNYTVSTKAGDEYYYDYGTLGAGFYYIKWYANCTAGVLNSSDWAHYYQIDKADPIPTLIADPNATITYGTNLTVTGDAITICPQEFANVSTARGGLGTGAYGVDRGPNSFSNPDNTIDGDWSTFSSIMADGNLRINYTKPSSAVNATWTVKDGTGTHDISLPSFCLNSSQVSIWIRGVNYGTMRAYCNQGGAYDDLLAYYLFYQNVDAVNFYEENITWFYEPLNSLYTNGTLVANPYSAVLGAGDYNFTWNSTGNDNYTANSTSVLVTVNKADLPISLYINGTDGDISVINSSIANFTANFTSGYSFPITLYTNLTGAMELWDAQNSPLTNYTDLSPYQARAYQAIANWTGNENYTYSQANHSLNLTYTAPAAPQQPSGGGGGSGNCYYNWTCSDWTPAKCPASGKQTRQCVNTGTCLGTLGKPLESQSCEYTSPIPKQLLDVKLTLESNRLIDSTKLTSLTTFQSFGKTPAEVNLTYTFLDSSGKQIYNETDQRTVYTELALQRKFGKLVLGAGNYSLVLVLQYVNVTEKFRQDFEVLPTEMQQAFLAEGGFGIYVLAFSFVLAFIFAFYSYQLMTKFKKDKSEIEKLESETEEPKQKQIRFK